MVNRSRDRALYDATIRHFGSWREALTEAGINLANVTRHKPKNRDRDAMLLWIRNRKEAVSRSPLAKSALRIETTPSLSSESSTVGPKLFKRRSLPQMKDCKLRIH